MNLQERFEHERLRLVLQGTIRLLPVAMMVATLLAVVFYATSGSTLKAVSALDGTPIDICTTEVSLPALALWCLITLGVLCGLACYSYLTLRKGFVAGEIPAIQQRMIVGLVLEGICWGGLLWLGVDHNTSPAATALLLAMLAANSSIAMALFSPIQSIYLAMMLPMMLTAILRFVVMDVFYYQMLAGFCLLFAIGQAGQGRLMGRDISDSIRLRFENLDLIARLEEEKREASAAREEAERANHDKSRFLAAASHDLRQPVQALQLLLESLSWSRLDAIQRQTLKSAQAASGASADMLNTLLDFSRIEAGVIHSQQRPCALQALFHKLEMELAPLADDRTLIYRSRDSEAVVHSDPALLELILRNLIANAIRYTDSGGVLVAARRRGGQCSIEVYDTGIGIATDQQREIFREFHQLGNPERDRRKGLGLGLATAERLAHTLGHALSLASIPGRGSVFRLRVPLAEEALPSHQTSSSPASTEASLAGQRLLVIDDDETILGAMQQLLTAWGCECVTADSLEGALNLDWSQPPQAILCDYRLRENTGAETIRHLRAHFGTDLPSLLLTGDTAPQRLREATASGIPLLHKPVSALELRQALVSIGV